MRTKSLHQRQTASMACSPNKFFNSQYSGFPENSDYSILEEHHKLKVKSREFSAGYLTWGVTYARYSLQYFSGRRFKWVWPVSTHWKIIFQTDIPFSHYVLRGSRNYLCHGNFGVDSSQDWTLQAGLTIDPKLSCFPAVAITVPSFPTEIQETKK